MLVKRITALQPSADGQVTVAIPTGLTVDARLGWSIVRIEATWVNISSTSFVVSNVLNVQLNTEATTQVYTDPDLVEWIRFTVKGTTAAVVGQQVQGFVARDLFVPRLTVEPNLFVDIVSTGTGQANNVHFALFYEQVKLTDLEVMRLLQGGA